MTIQPPESLEMKYKTNFGSMKNKILKGKLDGANTYKSFFQ